MKSHFRFSQELKLKNEVDFQNQNNLFYHPQRGGNPKEKKTEMKAKGITSIKNGLNGLNALNLVNSLIFYPFFLNFLGNQTEN